ncbi:MAG: hypothetical protein V3U76_04490 [Granulosicoccus sp.]
MQPIKQIISLAKWLGLCLLLTTSTLAATDVELLVIEQDYCPFCERFNRDITPGYSKTAEGRLAPLKQLDLHETWPAKYAEIKSATVTPTFILISDGKEIARLAGYPGSEYFWIELNEMLDKL